MNEDYEYTAVTPADPAEDDIFADTTAGEAQSERTLIEMLDEITAIITGAKNVPLSSSIVVNRTELLELLDTARAMVPEQLIAADSVLADAHAMHDSARDDSERRLAQARAKSDELAAEAKKHFDDVVAEAKAKAEGIVARAREEANRLVSQDSITQTARAEAKKIVDYAQAKARKLTSGANDYSDSMLENLGGQLVSLQDHIDDLLHQIDAGRDVIVQRSQAHDEMANAEGSPNGTARQMNQNRKHKGKN